MAYLHFVVIAIAFLCIQDISAEKKSNKEDDGPLTTHIIDTSIGLPGRNVSIVFFAKHIFTRKNKKRHVSWRKISSGRTDKNGRLGKFIKQNQFKQGVYRLRFFVAEYFKKQNKSTFFPFVDVYFRILHPRQHYHVPLLLNPYSYTTYRGQ